MKLFPSVMAALLFTSTSPLLMPTLSHADDSVQQKTENTAGAVKTDAKKDTRKVKRKARKAVGKDTMGKDAKDKVNDAGDDVSNSADKAKRKVTE